MDFQEFYTLLTEHGFSDVGGCISKNGQPLGDWYYHVDDTTVVDSVRIIDVNNEETKELKLLMLIHNMPVHMLEPDESESEDLYDHFTLWIERHS